MKRLTYFILAILLAAGIYTSAVKDDGETAADKPIPGGLLVHFIDIGQGDAAFIELPDGKTALIDAGEESDAHDVIAFVRSRGCKKINYIVATHPHSDHIGGMASVLNEFDADIFYMPEVAHTTASFETMLDAAKKNPCAVKRARAGVTIFEAEGLSASFVAPCSDKYEEINDYSAVIRLTYGDTSFLFTGDAQAVSENEMVCGNAPLHADVLKVSHHGSSTSTTAAFLEKVQPRFAVISVGSANRYGHPSPEVLERLSETGAAVYRTDENGTISAVSDGITLRFVCER